MYTFLEVHGVNTFFYFCKVESISITDGVAHGLFLVMKINSNFIFLDVFLVAVDFSL